MSIREVTIRGVKWTTVSTVSLTLANLIKISVLARLLNKSDFGLMALVTFVLGFMNLFMDLGLSSAILHRQQITREEYSSLFWINIIASIALFIFILIFSPAISIFYKEAELAKLIPLMSLSIIIAALGRQFKTIEQKELNFRYLAFTDIIGSLSGVITGVILAINGSGVYALVIGSLVHFGISNGILFIRGLRTRGIRFHFLLEETKPFLSIGLYQVGGQVVNYFNRDLDVLLIGKLMGTDVLGGYSLAKQFVSRPMQIINPILTRVASSIFPRYQTDFSALRSYFTELLKGLGSLYAFIYGSIAVLAPTLVRLFFGPELLSIAVYVQLFSFFLYFRAIGGNVGILVITTGRTDYDFYWNMLVTLIIPVAIFIGSHFSVEMVIIMLGLVQLVLLIPGWHIFYYRMIHLKIAPYLEALLIPLVLAGIVVFLNEFCFNRGIIIQLAMCLVLITMLSVYSYLRNNEFRLLLNTIYLKFMKY